MNCDENSALNTDKEIWREIEGDYYSPSIHVKANNWIGINVGGYVLVANIREWHDAGFKLFVVKSRLFFVKPSWKRWKLKIAFWLLGWK